MKTCGNCKNLCTDFDHNNSLSFLCQKDRLYTPTIQKEDVKFNYPITDPVKALIQLRIVFYAEVYCKDHKLFKIFDLYQFIRGILQTSKSVR